MGDQTNRKRGLLRGALRALAPFLAVGGIALFIFWDVIFPREDTGYVAGAPETSSGIRKLSVIVDRGPDGLTVEQQNIRRRLEEDNRAGAIKHHYIISPLTGQIIAYSTVRGKVTSSGKRLSPYTVAMEYSPTEYSHNDEDGYSYFDYRWVGGYELPDGNRTREVLQDGGAYGSSTPYLYWWDVQGVYHQHFVTDGQIVILRSQPLPNVPEIILRLDGDAPEGGD